MVTNPLVKGFLTSEFLVTIVGIIVGVLVALGKVSPDASNPLVQGVSALGGALITLFSTLTYINGRVEVKKAALTGTPDTTTAVAQTTT